MKRNSNSPVFSFIDTQELFPIFKRLVDYVYIEDALEKWLIILKISFYLSIVVSVVMFLSKGSFIPILASLLFGILVYLYDIIAGLIIGRLIFFCMRDYLFKSVEILKNRNTPQKVRAMKNAQIRLSNLCKMRYAYEIKDSRYYSIRARLGSLLIDSTYRLYPLSINGYEDYNQNIYTPSVLWRLFPTIMLKRHWDFRHSVVLKRLDEARRMK